MSRNKDMTHGNPTRLVVLFALPLMVGDLGQQLYTIIDAIIVGQGVGVPALAALGATDWTYWLFLWSIQSFAQGFAILVTQSYGAGDIPALKKSITMSALLCAAIGIVFAIVSLLMAKPLLSLLRTPEAIFADALAYVFTLFAGLTIVIAYNMAACILRAFGDGRSPLIAMAVAAIINIALDLLFVLVFHWGVVGAAVATLIAQLFAFLYCLYRIRKNPVLTFTKEDWRPDATMLRRLWRLGFPLALQHGFIAIGGMILQSVINGFGFLIVASFTATNKLYGLLESTAISFGYATSTYMGQNYGAKKPERIRTGMRSIARLCVLVSLCISLLMIIIGKPLLSLFISKAEPSADLVLGTAYQYLLVMSCSLAFLYTLHAYRSALQGLGITSASLVSGLIEFAMRVGVALLLPHLVGEIGLFFAEPAAWAAAAAYLVYSFYKRLPAICLHLSPTPDYKK